MRSALTMLIAVGFTLIFTLAVGADPTSEAHKAIAALYAKTDAAMCRKDVEGATAFCTKDYVTIRPNGLKGTLAEQRGGLRKFLITLDHIQMQTTIQKFRLAGKRAKVMTFTHFSAMSTVQANALLEVVGEAQTDWVRTSGGWRKSAVKALSQEIKVNGKKVPMPEN